MDWATVRWPIPLDQKPTLRIVSFGSHWAGALDRYQIHGLWCLHLYRYSGEVRVDGQALPIRPGHAGVTPPGAVLEYIYHDKPSVHAYAHFALRSAGRTVPIAAMQDVGPEFERMYRAIEEAIGAFQSRPRRAEVRLWDVLWQLADRSARIAEPHNAAAHPAVQEVLTLIELRLSEPLGVSSLADKVDLSRNHLARLFHATTGSTVAAYVRRRRVDRARHLLLNSTRPIKAIAAEVGIPDLHLFNKTIRRELGRPPRGYRQRGG